MTVRQVVSAMLGAALRVVPLRVLAGLAAASVSTIGRRASPRTALRLLFEIQSRVETLIATTAVDYGDGIHPKHRIMRYHDFFVERVRAGERVMDVGSGNGLLAHAMAMKGAKVVGMEMAPANIAKARTRFRHPLLTFCQGDVTRDPIPGEFDTIVMSNVLEHLRDRPALLSRLMRETGANRFLIRVPCFDRDWTVPLRKELGLDWRSDSTHETEYTLADFQAELSEAGLATTDVVLRWGEIWAVATADKDR